MTHKVAILGASGYTGAELVRLIAQHPNLEIVALSAERKAGMTMAQVFPHLRHMTLPTLCKISEIDFLFRVSCIFAITKHQAMWARDTLTVNASRKVGGAHGFVVQVA